ncbi:MAG: winged helix-turn-helix transcriptional regulator [Sphingomonadaceae bacterium]|nr:winged helix-turn-helix transcriptional regulator [Sphingomonadaceae bacterium]
MDRFTALGDPTRRAIIDLLAAEARPAGAIARNFESSAPAISQHLKVLRETGLVRVSREGTKRIYRLDPKALDEMEEWVARTRAKWNRRLDALGQAMENEEN